MPPRASATPSRRWPTSTASADIPARYGRSHAKDRHADRRGILEATEEKSIVVPLMGFSGSQEGIAPSNPCSGEMSKIP